MNEKQAKKHRDIVSKVLKMKDIFYLFAGETIYLSDGFVAYKTNIYLTDVNEVFKIEHKRNNYPLMVDQIEKMFSVSLDSLKFSIFPVFDKNKNKNFYVHIENGKIIPKLKKVLADNGPLINMKFLKFFRRNENLLIGVRGNNDSPILVKTDYLEMLVMPIIYEASKELKIKESLGDICEAV